MPKYRVESNNKIKLVDSTAPVSLPQSKIKDFCQLPRQRERWVCAKNWVVSERTSQSYHSKATVKLSQSATPTALQKGETSVLLNLLDEYKF